MKSMHIYALNTICILWFPILASSLLILNEMKSLNSSFNENMAVGVSPSKFWFIQIEHPRERQFSRNDFGSALKGSPSMNISVNLLWRIISRICSCSEVDMSSAFVDVLAMGNLTAGWNNRLFPSLEWLMSHILRIPPSWSISGFLPLKRGGSLWIHFRAPLSIINIDSIVRSTVKPPSFGNEANKSNTTSP